MKTKTWTVTLASGLKAETADPIAAARFAREEHARTGRPDTVTSPSGAKLTHPMQESR
jgi:hypothetical protein